MPLTIKHMRERVRIDQVHVGDIFQWGDYPNNFYIRTVAGGTALTNGLAAANGDFVGKQALVVKATLIIEEGQ